MILPLASGVLHYLSYPPLSWWPLGFFALVPLYIFLLREKSFWRIIGGSMLYRTVAVALFLAFLPDPFFILSVSVFWIGFGALAWVIARLSLPRYLHAVLLALLFVLGEYCTARFGLLPGYTATSGVTLAPSPLLPLAALGGVWSLGFILAFSNSSLAYLALRLLEVRLQRAILLRRALQGALAVFLFFCIVVGVSVFAPTAVSAPTLGLKVMSFSAMRSFDLDLVRREVNDPTTEEIPALAFAMSQRLLPIAEAIGKERPDLAIFPEDLFNLQLLESRSERAYDALGIKNAGVLLDAYAAIAKSSKVHILAVMTTHEKDGKKYDSAVHIDREGNFAGIYHKRDLVVAGEYWPFGSWYPFYWDWEIAALPPETRRDAFVGFSATGKYSPREGKHEPFLIDGVTVGLLICSEGQLAGGYSNLKDAGASFIVHDGSAAWLSHLQKPYLDSVMNFRRIQAVYYGLPIIVSGKDEASAIILPSGEVKTAQFKGDWGYLTVVL